MPGFGASDGFAVRLPWDKMMDREQYLKQREQQYIANNEQKLAKIADMEQQTYTDLPIFNQHLEKYYEGLHEETGKIISQYGGDPFKSLDGMNALNTQRTKFLNNPILNNANQSKAAYQRLMEDYKAGHVTTSDFQKYQNSYTQFGQNGDPKTGISMPWNYTRPDYKTENDMVKDISSGFEKAVLGFDDTSKNYSVGFQKGQFSKMADLALEDPKYEPFIEKVQNRMKEQGVDPSHLHTYLQDVFKQHLPAMFHPGPKGSGSGTPLKPLSNTSSFENIIVTDSTENNENVKNFVPTDSDGNISQKMLAFGPGNEAYSIPFKGNAKLVSTGYFDNDSKVVDGTVVLSRQDYMDGLTNKLNKAAKDAGLKGVNMWITSELETSAASGTAKYGNQNPSKMSEQDFINLAKAAGYSTDTPNDIKHLIALNDRYMSNDPRYHDYDDAYNGVHLPMQPDNPGQPDSKTGHYDQFSANALLADMMYSHGSDVAQNAQLSGPLKAIALQLRGNDEGKHLMKVTGVKLNTSYHLDQLAAFNKASGDKQEIYNNYTKALGRQGASQEYPVQGRMSWAMDKNGYLMGPVQHKDGVPIVRSNMDDIPKNELAAYIYDAITDPGIIRKMPDLAYRKEMTDYHRKQVDAERNNQKFTEKPPEMSVEDMKNVMQQKLAWAHNPQDREKLINYGNQMMNQMIEQTGKSAEELNNNPRFKFYNAMSQIDYVNY